MNGAHLARRCGAFEPPVHEQVPGERGRTGAVTHADAVRRHVGRRDVLVPVVVEVADRDVERQLADAHVRGCAESARAVAQSDPHGASARGVGDRDVLAAVGVEVADGHRAGHGAAAERHRGELAERAVAAPEGNGRVACRRGRDDVGATVVVEVGDREASRVACDAADRELGAGDERATAGSEQRTCGRRPARGQHEVVQGVRIRVAADVGGHEAARADASDGRLAGEGAVAGAEADPDERRAVEERRRDREVVARVAVQIADRDVRRGVADADVDARRIDEAAVADAEPHAHRVLPGVRHRDVVAAVAVEVCDHEPFGAGPGWNRGLGQEVALG